MRGKRFAAVFDEERKGGMDVDEFSKAWRQLVGWKEVFDKVKTPPSDTINGLQLKKGLEIMKYKLPGKV